MSLDVYLTMTGVTVPTTDEKIYIREDGRTRKITRAEWDARNPGREPFVIVEGTDGEVFWRNITHNLNTMADMAGLYECVWRPDEHGMKFARDLIDPMRAGLERLKADPDYYRTFNPFNGWGDYEGLVDFVEKYLDACERYPDAEVSVSR